MRISRLAMLASAIAMVVALASPSAALAKKPGDANPMIASLSGYASPSGTVITITGSGFGETKTSSWVTFAGVRGTHLSWTDTEITAMVPARPIPGYVGVVVDGIWSNGMYFVPFAPPTIASISSSFGGVGTLVTITGTGFGALQNDGAVTFAGVTAPVRSWSDTSVVVAVPEGAPAGYLGLWQNTLCSNGMWFVPGDMPAIESLSSDLAVVGSQVIVTGQHFGTSPPSGLALTVGGEPVVPDSWSDTQITFTVPPAAESGYVGVWKDDLCSNGIFLLVGPRIDVLSGWWGEPGSQLTIAGAGFGSSIDRVTLGGLDVPVLSWGDTEIVVDVPANEIEGYVGVWRGDACSNGLWFVASVQPVISSVDSTSVISGQAITVSGSGFGEQSSSSRLRIGSTDLEITSWSAEQVVAVVPAGTPSGYLGVWKKGIASNGVWTDVAP